MERCHGWIPQAMVPRRPMQAGAWAAGLAVLLVLAVWGLSGSGTRQLRPAEPSSCARPTSWWHTTHQTMSSEAAAAEASDQGWDVVFYGDSLVETLRGTTRGGPCERCGGVAKVFERHVGKKFRAKAFGIAGDQTAHLLWRLQHGELPQTRPPRLAALLIGTNDLGAASDGGEATILPAVDATVQRYEQIVRHLQTKAPATQLLLLGLLPRGTPSPPNHYAGMGPYCASSNTSTAGSSSNNSSSGGDGGGSSSIGGGGNGRAASRPARRSTGPASYEQPSIFSAALASVNERLEALAARSRRLHFVGCGGSLLLHGNGSIDATLMPDALHPNAAGYELLFSKCWGAAVEAALVS